MAIATANTLRCPKPLAGRSSCFSRPSTSTAPLIFSVKFLRRRITDYRLVCVATSSASSPHADGNENEFRGLRENVVEEPAAGSPNATGDENPYTVLGASGIEGFDDIKTAYTRKRKDAERRGDEEHVAKLDRAYDKIMMLQLTNRKKGMTFGSFQVSKDIKYADKQPIVPWAPRPSKSSVKDMRINMAISAVFTIWILIKRNAEWKPLQFLAFIFFYRVFEKLKAFEPAASPVLNEYGEDEGRGLRMGKRLLRSIGLVFGCMAFASLAYTGVLNLIEFVGGYIPVVLYNNQEVIVTASTSALLYIIATFYR